jgi:hypothetical protein
MAKTSDVTDPALRAELDAAEELLDDGNYDESVQKSADIYCRLVATRPDLIIERRQAELSAVNGRPERPRFAPWPATLGVTLGRGEDGQPKVIFEKDTFVMSEAATYFEYALEAAVRAQETSA